MSQLNQVPGRMKQKGLGAPLASFDHDFSDEIRLRVCIENLN